MEITINIMRQRSFRLKHGSYMYNICVSEMSAILNMATQEASGDVESSHFGLTTVKKMKRYKNIQIRHVKPMWKIYFLLRPSLKMAAIVIF